MSNFAVDYLNAAKFLVESQDYQKGSCFSSPEYFLYSHGLELLLKSYLMMHGFDDVKRCGHNLMMSYELCLKYGLPPLGEEFKVALELLNNYHSSLENRYIVTGAKTLPNFQILTELTKQLMKDIKPTIDEHHRQQRLAKTYNLTANG